MVYHMRWKWNTFTYFCASEGEGDCGGDSKNASRGTENVTLFSLSLPGCLLHEIFCCALLS